MKIKDYLKIKEDLSMGTLPANNVGSGKIAGTTNDPPVNKKKRRPKLVRRDRAKL